MVKIRPAVRSDAAAIVSVRQEAIFSKASAHYAPGILDAWAASAMPDREARVELQIADPGFVVLVAETGEEIIGYAIATPARSELRAVYVKPNPIGRVGRALLEAIEQRAFNSGTEFLVCSASLSGEAFYKFNGYTEDHRGHYRMRNGDLMDCVFMRKKLAPPAPADKG